MKVEAPVTARRDWRASRARRLAAALVDGAIIAPLVLAFTLTLAAPSDSATWLLVSAILLVAGMSYQALLLTHTGQSLGKRWLGIAVEEADGGRVGRWTVALRFWLPALIVGAALQCPDPLAVVAPSLAPPAPFAGWVVALGVILLDVLPIFLPARRCLHDYVAYTNVVSGPPAPPQVEHLRLATRAAGVATAAILVPLALLLLGMLAVGVVLFFRWFGHMG